MISLADSEGPDQTARMRSLIWAFAVRIWSEGTFSLDGANKNKGKELKAVLTSS